MIKVTCKGNDLSFPKLMSADNGMIVLFSEEQVGTIVRGSPGSEPIGYYSKIFAMSCFTDYKAIVELENKADE